MAKKCKHFGLRLELHRTYNAFCDLRTALLCEDDIEADEPVQDKLNDIITLLKLRLEGSQSLTFSTLTNDLLVMMNIMSTGMIFLEYNLEEHIWATTLLGGNGLWSSQQLCCQL
ncbi:hypothetical protein OG21DRAFT_1489420 [Imleria badia]|nr:hypothetical protein OG21DRAFT_1489420 [Imleria badia]